jgi:ribosomal protein S18 acetylase RimI-like enzyme
MAAAPDTRRESGRISVRLLRRRDRTEALAHLEGRARDNLFLVDLVRQTGGSAGGDGTAEVLGAWRGEVLVGLASLRPTLVLEAGLEPVARTALLGPLCDVSAGLIRSDVAGASALWERLHARGCRALVDRCETSLVLDPAWLAPAPAPAGIAIRPAAAVDLEPLVEAARASLREEGRPDPFLGDPRGFRRWVSARVPRARVATVGQRVVWVGYADVRLAEGWLLQGVYTWPDWRRRGLAAAGISSLCRAAFSAGAEHVQLSVVEGNAGARRLYEALGFRPHATLRTLLFA